MSFAVNAGKMPDPSCSSSEGDSTQRKEEVESNVTNGSTVSSTTSWFSARVRTWWERVTKFTCDAVILIIKCIGPA